MQNNHDLTAIVEKLKQAKKICILTGAGFSAESGIPTFRDKQTGLWENFRAEELASVQGFQKNPELVWQWYQMRRNAIKDKQPNPAHHALAQWQQHADKLGQTITLISQNVDDLHEQAGSLVYKLHGNLWQNKCSQCGLPYTHEVKQTKELLFCEQCHGKIRPDVVWFGENLPKHEWQVAELAAFHCDVFISIGTSSTVYPAAGLADIAKESPGYPMTSVIEINPNPSLAKVVDYFIPEKAGEFLPQLVERMCK